MRMGEGLTRRSFLRQSASASLALSALGTLGPLLADARGTDPRTGIATPNVPREDPSVPNIILINADDLGYGDLGCYGGRAIRTPRMDGLAEDGVRFTDFYSCNALCSPSRFGLLTGRYPQRVGMHWVLWPEEMPLGTRLFFQSLRFFGKIDLMDHGAMSEVDGIPADEVTLSEALNHVGYRTAMVGKWHLGDFLSSPEYHPLRHGFDEFFGVPYSNDMHPFPLCRNAEVLEANIEDQSKLTGLYTEEATKFIGASSGRPFFLYLAHTFPHQPLHASDNFVGASRAGRYGDTVEEIDWSVGQILDCLERNGRSRDTLVFLTSDNGPWYHGSTGMLRGRKGQSFDGGVRIPMIARWPGHIPEGRVCREPAMNIDFFPTCLAIAGAELPSDRIIDGRDIRGLLAGEEEQSPPRRLFFYHFDRLEAVREGKWKYYREINTYVFPKPLDRRVPSSGKGEGPPWLYDLETDPGESYSLHKGHPEIGRRLSGLMDEWSQHIESNPRGWTR